MSTEEAVSNDHSLTAAAPPSAFSDPPPDAVPPEPKVSATPTYFDWQMHERVQSLHKKGVWTDLGERWGGLWVRLRPFHVHAVVVRRETVEQKIRTELSLSDDDPIPAERGVEVNRAAVTMAITGAKNRLSLSPAMLDTAKLRGFKLLELPDGVTLAELDGEEEPEHMRELMAPMLASSMPFLNMLIRAARQLQTVKDAELDKLGEAFVFGQHIKLDWAD